MKQALCSDYALLFSPLFSPVYPESKYRGSSLHRSRREEIQHTLRDGWSASDAKPGVLGKVMIFPYHEEWGGRIYEEKEVAVYYKLIGGEPVLLTVKARYGKDFPRGEKL